MQFASIMKWKPEDAEKITEMFLKWKVPEGIKWIAGPYTMLGQNKSLSIMEGDDDAWIKVDRYWRSVCTWETYPIVESAKIAKM
jgi:hypothetical protein